MKLIYLIRHGQYFQREKHITDGPPVGPEADQITIEQDGGLTAVGVEQAELLAARFEALSINVIHSSSLPRALETAQIIARGFPAASFTEHRDLWECVPHVPAKLASQAASLPTELLSHEKALADSAFQKYFQVNGENDVSEVLVCHGNIIRYFICRALGITADAWVDMETCNCSISSVSIAPDGERKLVSLNDTGHLPNELITYQSVKISTEGPPRKVPNTLA